MMHLMVYGVFFALLITVTYLAITLWRGKK